MVPCTTALCGPFAQRRPMGLTELDQAVCDTQLSIAAFFRGIGDVLCPTRGTS